jgi:hypothetical protein
MHHYKKTGQLDAPLYEKWTTGCSIIRKLDLMLHYKKTGQLDAPL